MGKFTAPNFENGDLELRYEDETICIYGTPAGLIRLAELCHKLVEKKKEDHLHLEDHGLLTKNSLSGVIALFKKQEK